MGGGWASSKQASKQQASKQLCRALSGPQSNRRPEIEKNVTALSGMVFRNFCGTNFFLVGPPPVGNGDLVVFWPVLGLGHLEKFRARAENRKTQFPGARGTFGEKVCPPQNFLPEIAQPFYILCFGRPDPQGR